VRPSSLQADAFSVGFLLFEIRGEKKEKGSYQRRKKKTILNIYIHCDVCV
jgi:stalled ribosome alternative rescue factor ArfA